jgi:hypothetical protein
VILFYSPAVKEDRVLQFNKPFPERPDSPPPGETEQAKKIWEELKKLLAACQLKGAVMFYTGEKYNGALANSCDDAGQDTLASMEIAKRGIINEFAKARAQLDLLDKLSGAKPVVLTDDDFKPLTEDAV